MEVDGALVIGVMPMTSFSGSQSVLRYHDASESSFLSYIDSASCSLTGLLFLFCGHFCVDTTCFRMPKL